MDSEAPILGGAGVRYDSAKHLYSDQFGAIPSVTQALRACGMIDGSYHNESAAWRGTVVHHAIALESEGRLDESTLHTDLRGYLVAWRAAKGHLGLRGASPLHVENRVASKTMRVAGTVDLAYRQEPILTVIDIKTGSSAPWHRVQIAGYAALLAEHHALPGTRMRGAVVYVAADGKFSVTNVYGADMADAIGVFRAVVRVANWRLAHGWNPVE